MSGLNTKLFPTGWLLDPDGDFTGPNTGCPVGVSKKIAAKWSYRVKKWKVTGDFSGWNASASNDHCSANASAPALEYFLETEVTDEKQFTCEIPRISNDDYVEDVDNDEEDGVIRRAFARVFVRANITITGSDTGPMGYFRDGLYWPKLFFSFEVDALALQDDYDPSSHGLVGQSIAIHNDPFTPDGTVTINMDGVPIELPYEHFVTPLVGEGVSVGTNLSTLDIQITPVEFWPYDSGSGPVYNTSTGARL